MNFYGIRDLSNNTKNVMTSVNTNKKVIITDNGKPSAIMLSINEANFEALYFRWSKRYRNFYKLSRK